MIIYAITFILAFCSIVYELLLGQTLSAFLGNTVLRYSVTIGLYMMSLCCDMLETYLCTKASGTLITTWRRLGDDLYASQRLAVLFWKRLGVQDGPKEVQQRPEKGR